MKQFYSQELAKGATGIRVGRVGREKLKHVYLRNDKSLLRFFDPGPTSECCSMLASSVRSVSHTREANSEAEKGGWWFLASGEHAINNVFVDSS
jgi:hypothetical protein